MNQTIKKYDFRSVGRLEGDFEASLIDEAEGVPVGIQTPLALTSYGNAGPFQMRTNLGEQIRDNFRNMLATNHGDRLMLYDFGANLAGIAFEIGSEDGDVTAINRIRKTTEKYMPFIALQTFEPITEQNENNSQLAIIGIRVLYGVPTIGLSNQAVEVIIYAAG